MSGRISTGRGDAEQLAEAITLYWAARGWPVQVEIVEAGWCDKHLATRYDVRSNMVNGLPPAPDRRGEACS